MTTLYQLGLERDWVHSELRHLILTIIIHQNKGTKARANHILKLIEKQKLQNLRNK